MLFPQLFRVNCFPENSSRQTLRDRTLSDLLYSVTKQKQILTNAVRFTCNSGQHFAGNSELLDVKNVHKKVLSSVNSRHFGNNSFISRMFHPDVSAGCFGWSIRLMKELFPKSHEQTELSTFLWTFFTSKVYTKCYTGSLFICLTVNCFPIDVILFAMFPLISGIWQERVSLLDAMWPWTRQWMGAL